MSALTLVATTALATVGPEGASVTGRVGGRIVGVAVPPHAGWAAAASTDRHAYVLELPGGPAEQGQRGITPVPHPRAVTALAAPTNDTLVTTSLDGAVRWFGVHHGPAGLRVDLLDELPLGAKIRGLEATTARDAWLATDAGLVHVHDRQILARWPEIGRGYAVRAAPSGAILVATHQGTFWTLPRDENGDVTRPPVPSRALAPYVPHGPTSIDICDTRGLVLATGLTIVVATAAPDLQPLALATAPGGHVIWAARFLPTTPHTPTRIVSASDDGRVRLAALEPGSSRLAPLAELSLQAAGSRGVSCRSITPTAGPGGTLDLLVGTDTAIHRLRVT